MNDFEKVINDLKRLKDESHRGYCWNVSVTNVFISYDDYIEMVQNAIDLLEEYNNDRG